MCEKQGGRGETGDTKFVTIWITFFEQRNYTQVFYTVKKSDALSDV